MADISEILESLETLEKSKGKIKIRTETSNGCWTEQEINHIHDDVIKDIDMMLVLNEPKTIFEERRERHLFKYNRYISSFLKYGRIKITRYSSPTSISRTLHH